MLPNSSQHILRPVRARTVVFSFVGALFLVFLPWTDLRLVPDFVALVLVFWCVHQPRLIGLGTGWFVGLLVDAGNGVFLGQHALAYSCLAFLAVGLSRRILWLGIWGQALYVGGLLVAALGVASIVRLATGAQFPGWSIAIGPLLGLAMWPALSWLLLLPQRRPVESRDRL